MTLEEFKKIVDEREVFESICEDIVPLPGEFKSIELWGGNLHFSFIESAR